MSGQRASEPNTGCDRKVANGSEAGDCIMSKGD